MSFTESLGFPPRPPTPVEQWVLVSAAHPSTGLCLPFFFKSKGFPFGRDGGGACGPLSRELANGGRSKVAEEGSHTPP